MCDGPLSFPAARPFRFHVFRFRCFHRTYLLGKVHWGQPQKPHGGISKFPKYPILPFSMFKHVQYSEIVVRSLCFCLDVVKENLEAHIKKRC